MNSLSDSIEQYLKEILAQTHADFVEVKRRELASTFHCVPSQINYVISTRFTLEKGYLIESKRGGGGFIRIYRVPLEIQGQYLEAFLREIGDSISPHAAEHMMIRLYEEKCITKREVMLMQRLMTREILQLPSALCDEVRARMMKAMLVTLFGCKGE